MELSELMPKSKKTTAILACGGRGTRMGENKLLINLCGKSVIRRSAEAVLSSRDVIGLVVAAPKELWPVYSRELDGLGAEFAEAGSTRSESVRSAFSKVTGDIVLIHDGARPLVSKGEIQRSIDDCFEFGSSVICTPTKDTLRFSDGEKSFSPPRENLYTVRTPQTFSTALYGYALSAVSGDFTDDAQLLDRIGVTPHITVGEYKNIKLTTRDDLVLAKLFLGGGSMRIGHGYDVHRLEEGRDLILGGVKIDYEKGLLGHSDADVLVHAIMDSLLGAAALGDIGKLFPDTDPKYSGADSIELLKAVSARVREAGYEIGNIDATVIAQAPKLSPHIEKMRENIARAAGVDIGDVSVKATTEEKLGFSGRGEGISAHAVCILK